MKKRLACVLVAAMILIFSVPALSGSKEVVYRLKWKFNTSVAGDIYADAAGFFKKNELSVDVKAGGVGIDAIRELELGRAHFGVASADQVIMALEKGARIIVIAQIFQANPLQWIYRADKQQIISLRNLKGLRIGVTFGGNDDAIMQTLLTKAGLGRSDVKILSVQGNAIPFFRKKADLWPVYRNSQGVSYENKLNREGEAVQFFNPQDFGVSFVANSVVTTEALMRDLPDLVTAFLNALLGAWEAAMDTDNAASVLAAVKKLDGGTNADIRAKQLAATRILVKPGSRIRIGHIDVPAWEQTESILLTQGLIRKQVDIKTHLIAP